MILDRSLPFEIPEVVVARITVLVRRLVADSVIRIWTIEVPANSAVHPKSMFPTAKRDMNGDTDVSFAGGIET